MQDNSVQLITKTIRMDKDLVDRIQKMANDHDRNFSQQLRFMIKEYLRIKDSK